MSQIRPFSYIPSNVSTTADQIEILLKKSNPKHRPLYQSSDSADVIIMNQGKQLRAHSQVLKAHTSLSISKRWVNNGFHPMIETQSKVKKQLFQKVLSSFYGYGSIIKRADILDVYQLACELQAQELKNICYSDIVNRFQQYDIFPLLKLANLKCLKQIQRMCYEQLEIEHFEPLRYSKSGLFMCSQELLILILKKHNQLKYVNEKFGLTRHQIDALVCEYCEFNRINFVNKQKILKKIKQVQISNNNCLTLTEASYNNSITPRRSKSSSEIFFRNTLTLPRTKPQEKNSSFQITKKCCQYQTSENYNSDSEQDKINSMSPCVPIKTNRIASNKVIQKSLSNESTDNRSNKVRSRRESFGSLETLSDPKIITTVSYIQGNQKMIEQNIKQMNRKVQQMDKKLQKDKQNSKQNAEKLKKLESYLKQVEAEMKNEDYRLKQVAKILDVLQKTAHTEKARKQFEAVFQKNNSFQCLSESTNFPIRITGRERLLLNIEL